MFIFDVDCEYPKEKSVHLGAEHVRTYSRRNSGSLSWFVEHSWVRPRGGALFWYA